MTLDPVSKSQRGQAALEVVLMTGMVTAVAYLVLTLIGPRLQAVLLDPIKNNVENVVRFGVAEQSPTPIIDSEPMGTVKHPFHPVRNLPIH